MKKISIILICILTATLLLAACGKKEEVQVKENDRALVGTWTESFFDSGWVFNDDETGLDTFWNLSFTYTAYDGVITITYDSDMYGIALYDYTITGDTLSMTRQDDRTEAFEYKKQSGSSKSAPKATTSASDSETDESKEGGEEETTTTAD